ncbi:unnamed protein product [Blepharisma stoltei]|uniref:Uncharacterized protein n=1 Tax=Blepharisma stoltei TaxID=1481888 RepID=A0AAU9IIJ3_9CILI|nr:unnamed protein product [Blepharisma stoltei]
MHEGALKALKNLLEGVIEALPPDRGLSRLSRHIDPLIDSLQRLLPFIVPSQIQDFLEVLDTLVTNLSEKIQELGNVSELTNHIETLIKMILKAESMSRKEPNDKLGNKILSSIINITAYEETRTKSIGSQSNFLAAFTNILKQLENSNMEYWHPLDQNWQIFVVAVHKVDSFHELTDCKLIIDQALNIMKIVSKSERLFSIHREILTLAKYSFFDSEKIVKTILASCLLGDCPNKELKSSLRLEVLEMLSLFGVSTAHKKLTWGLYQSLSDSNLEVVAKSLEELHIQLETLKNIVLEKPDFLSGFVYKNKEILPALTAKFLEFFENPNENIQLSSTLVLQDLLQCLPVVVFDILNVKNPISHDYYEKFEEELLGNFKEVIRKVVATYLSQPEGPFKESLHSCLLIIKEKNSKAIYIEAIEAKSAGMLKRWDYLNAIFHLH